MLDMFLAEDDTVSKKAAGVYLVFEYFHYDLSTILGGYKQTITRN